MIKYILIGLCVFSVLSGGIAAQNNKVNLKSLLDKIEKTHDVEFNYDEDLVLSKTLNIEAKYELNDVDEFLKKILPALDLFYLKIDTKTYVITPNPKETSKIRLDSKKYLAYAGQPVESLMMAYDRKAIKITLTGNVTDESGEGLPGVNIIITGTLKGTVTDVEGNYSIEVAPEDQLTYSYVGYKTVTQQVNSRAIINVVLAENFSTMDEVVIIGYGTARKSDLTGSLSSVTGEDLASTPIASLDQGLQGRAAGVQVTQVSGKPGGGTSIRIRGTSSISAGNEPLYIIDGMMIMSNSGETSAGGTRGPKINPLSSINPNDIASIEILKDASALAIYGSRGSNGVVLVTTKKGKAGASTINFDSYYGVQRVKKTLDLLNGEQFARFITEVEADKGFPLDPDYLIPENYGEGTNWQDAIFRDAIIQSYQINFSGGDKKTTFHISAGYFDQEGIIVSSDFQRVNLRSNLTRKISDRMELGTNLSISNVQSNGVLTNNGTLLPGVSMSALLFPPTQPVFDDAVPGGYTYDDNRGRNLVNPYADAVEVQEKTTNRQILGTVYLTFELFEGLKYKLNFGFDAFANKDNRFVPNYLKRTQNNNGEAVVATVNGLSWLLEHTLAYNKNIGNRHKIDAVVGYTTQAFNAERLFTASLDFDDNTTGYNAIQFGNKPFAPFTSVSEWGIISYLGRVNYIFDDKYLFTISGRVDGSSKFGDNNKYGFFPSGSFGWRISDENFYPESALVNFAKIRLSYGVIGNEDIGSYNSLSTVGLVGEGTFGNDEAYKGKGPQRLANPDLRWEKANQFDGGIDLELMESRFSLNFDYYLRFTSDLLLNDQVGYTTGFGSTVRNIGSIRNNGFEFSLNTVNIDDRIKWTTQFNTGYNLNKVTDLASDGNEIPIAGVLNLPTGWSILRIGEPVGSLYGLETDGIFQSDAEIQNSALLTGQENDGSAQPGDRKYKDLNGRDSEGNLTGVPDGIINEADRTIIGQTNPNFTWGLTNKVEFAGFDLSVFVQGAHGHNMVNANLFEIGALTAQTNVLQEYYDNRWTAENPSNEYPKVNTNQHDRYQFSDALVENASYVRIQNVSLGYRFRTEWLDKLKMSSARVYVSVNNVHTFTKYSGYDPEGNAFGQSTLFRGIDYGGYPTAKSTIIGIQLTF